MIHALLLRIADAPHGVFGFLYLRDDRDSSRSLRLATVEDDWLDNLANKSCIPAGTYTCVPRRFNRGGYDTWYITGVPGRDLCLFHIANTEENVEGCTGLGLDFSALTVADEDDPQQSMRLKWAVSGSKVAHAQFMAFLAGEREFLLEVRWSRPGEWRDRP